MTNQSRFFGASSRSLVGVGLVAVTLLSLSTPLFVEAATLNRQLELEMTGSDVSALQTFLALDSTLYPQGLVTGYFGFLTKSAVSNFQSRNNIDPVGRVGPITLVALNAQMSGSPTSIGDRTVPVLFNVKSNVGNNSATVSWATNELTRAQVYYDTADLRSDEATGPLQLPYVSGTLAFDNGMQTNHSITIQNLQSNTTYYYLVRSIDSTGNMSMTLPVTFRTN